MASRLEQVRQMVASEGPLRTAGHALGYLAELALDGWQDLRLGIRTTRRVSTGALGLHSPFSEKYAPSDYRSLRAVLRDLELRPGEDVFLDYGSGKGRVLILAAGLPFRRVLGIDLSPDLNRQAELNLARARRRRVCHDVRVLEADAGSFDVPDDVSLAYFYSPFTGDTLRASLARLRASWERNPRRLRILFKDPDDFEREVRAHAWLSKTRTWGERAGHARRRYVLYESVPPTRS